jgi:hypothetical protein
LKSDSLLVVSLPADRNTGERAKTTRIGQLRHRLNFSACRIFGFTLLLGFLCSLSVYGADNRKPILSGISASSITASSATIKWTTNERSTSQVEYGVTTGYGSVTPINTTLVTSHQVTLSNLQGNKLYYYRVKSKDATGNLAVSKQYTFKTLDPPPVISNVTAYSITTASGEIEWNTNEGATTQVDYGLTTSYGASTALDSTMVTLHASDLSSLLPDTVYHFRVKSKDSAGNVSMSNDYTLKTLASDAPAVLSNIQANSITYNASNILWNTNEGATSQVDYGEQITYGSSTALDSNMLTSHSMQLTNLKASTLYHYRVKSVDSSGNLSTSTDFTFLTAPQPGPVLSAISVGPITADSAKITWQSDVAATSQVDYGETTGYGSTTPIDSTLVTSHSVSLNSLKNATQYHYRVTSKNSAGTSTTSGDYTFTTGSDLYPGPAKAFPRAVGFGISTPGGRGGAILVVTNLNDSGSGSLREAVQATGKRTVIFEVSGTIQLQNELKIRNPYLTIAGQTAPSPGITLRGAELNVNTHDVIIQHIRVRVGDIQPTGIDIGGVDTVSTDGPGSVNVVIDHVSMSWSIDENASSWYDGLHDVTFSNCIISEGLYASIHPKGPHSMGFLVVPNGRNFAVLNNLVAHNGDRNPLLSTGSSVVVSNNLFYNWMGGRATNIGNVTSSITIKYPTLVTLTGNSYIGGLDTPSSTYAISDNTSLNTGSQVYQSDNRLEKVGGLYRNNASFNPLVGSAPISISGFSPIASSSVESVVLANAGARPTDRDAVDVRIVNSVKARNGRIINSQADVGGWPALTANYRKITIPSNPNGDDDGDGYTNFEEQVLFPMADQVEGK